jgi:hypothetical protein
MKGGCISRQGCCEEVKGVARRLRVVGGGAGWRKGRKKFYEVGVRGGIVFCGGNSISNTSTYLKKEKLH